MKRQINGADTPKTLCTTLSYPYMKDFKWVIQSNHIKDFLVTVQDIDAALKIWGKIIAALKGKTTRSKSITVAFMTTEIFFVNKIPIFLMLSHKICFVAVNHLADHTVLHIFKAFKEMCQYYLQCGFHSMPMVNLHP
jgi:hypothetical protein